MSHSVNYSPNDSIRSKNRIPYAHLEKKKSIVLLERIYIYIYNTIGIKITMYNEQTHLIIVINANKTFISNAN